MVSTSEDVQYIRGGGGGGGVGVFSILRGYQGTLQRYLDLHHGDIVSTSGDIYIRGIS